MPLSVPRSSTPSITRRFRRLSRPANAPAASAAVAALLMAVLLPVLTGCGGGGGGSRSTTTDADAQAAAQNESACLAYAGDVAVTAVIPNTAKPGTRITIKGRGFNRCTISSKTWTTPLVMFGQEAAPTRNTMVIDDSTMTVLVPIPVRANETVDVRVSAFNVFKPDTPQTTSAPSPEARFTYNNQLQ